jgi:histidinol-phosphate aminotransferase
MFMLSLHRNENSLGLSPSVRAILQSMSHQAYGYPAELLSPLRNRLAQQYKTSTAQVICGAGSTDVLRMALQALALRPDARLFCSVPFYPRVKMLTRHHLPMTQVPLDQRLCVDIDALRHAVAAYRGNAVVYLSNPDCHTGELLRREVLLDWMREAGSRVFFIVDEAYMEFVPDATARSLAECVQSGAGNVLVLRTFSKAFGLAGVRIGYGLTSAKNARELSRFGAASTISLPAACAALDALEDTEWLMHSRVLVDVSRGLLIEGLDSLGLEYRSGYVNFVLHALPCGGLPFRRSLRSRGVRVVYPVAGVPGWCRVAVGTPDEVSYYLDGLKSCM